MFVLIAFHHLCCFNDDAFLIVVVYHPMSPLNRFSPFNHPSFSRLIIQAFRQKVRVVTIHALYILTEYYASAEMDVLVCIPWLGL